MMRRGIAHSLVIALFSLMTAINTHAQVSCAVAFETEGHAFDRLSNSLGGFHFRDSARKIYFSESLSFEQKKSILKKISQLVEKKKFTISKDYSRIILDRSKKVPLYSQKGEDLLTTAEYDFSMDSLIFRNDKNEIPLIVRAKWTPEADFAGWQVNQTQLKKALSLLNDGAFKNENLPQLIVTATSPVGTRIALKAQLINEEVHLKTPHGQTEVILTERWMIESQDRNDRWNIDLFALQEKIDLLKESIQKIRSAIPNAL